MQNIYILPKQSLTQNKNHNGLCWIEIHIDHPFPFQTPQDKNKHLTDIVDAVNEGKTAKNEKIYRLYLDGDLEYYGW